MPVDMKRYPKHWKDISKRIRDRSNGQCECTGECGLHSHRCLEWNGQVARFAKGRVILTVAHLGVRVDKHDKMDCEDDNLKAMCQRCHLVFDMPEHMENAKRTRTRKFYEKQDSLEI